MILFLSLVVISYVLGSMPFALLIGKLRGVDVRTVGSGNVGATNVFRTVGKSWGVLAFLCDAAKGFIPAWLFPHFLDSATDTTGLVLGCAAIAGHNWPVFLRFKGGKGIATSAGVLLGVAPAAVAIGLVVWVLICGTTRYVSAASIGAAAAISISSWPLYLDNSIWLPVALTLLGSLAIWRHRTNITRLLNGTENRFGSSAKK